MQGVIAAAELLAPAYLVEGEDSADEAEEYVEVDNINPAQYYKVWFIAYGLVGLWSVAAVMYSWLCAILTSYSAQAGKHDVGACSALHSSTRCRSMHLNCHKRC